MISNRFIPHRISHKILAMVTLLIIGCSESDTFLDTPTSSVDLEVLQYNEWEMAEEILTQINTYRLELSIEKIELDKKSASALAVEHCIYMIENDHVGHTNFPARNLALMEGGAIEVGENIAFGYKTSKAVIKAWIKSTSHKKVLENNYNHIGIGVIISPENRIYVTALFYLM